MVVTVVGGGASAHVLIPFLAGAGHTVQLLTRRPSEWSSLIELQLRSIDNELEQTFRGELSRTSDEPRDLIPQSDLIILCMPVCTYRKALGQLASHLRRDREVFVGTIYGQAGFNWMTEEIARRENLDNVVTFAVGLIPWICRAPEYGKIGVTYGCKAVNVAAVSPRDRFDELNRRFLDSICSQWLDKGRFVQADSFLSLTLSVDNQIIHPSRCFGLFQRYGASWPNESEIPYFYRDFDELSADLLRKLDADYTKVRDGIRLRFPEHDFVHMLDYLGLERLSYQSTNTDIRESFTSSKTLGAIKPPTKQRPDGSWIIDTNHRFFTDDISYGVAIAKWMAQEIGIEVPMIDTLIGWVQDLRGESYIRDGRLVLESESLSGLRAGIPPVYGIDSLAGVLD